MKRVFFLMLLSFTSMLLMAQGKGSSIKGIVLEPDNTPVEFASVALLSDSKIVSGVITDNKGAFILSQLKDGTYTVRISSVGYNTISRTVQISGNKQIDLGKITLAQESVALGEVVVEGQAASKNVTVEKTRINTTSSMAGATGSLLEIIRNSSSVTVDGNDNISIRGNSNVLILLDGVPTTIGGLRGIPAANVKSIDIMTSPDVKHDSEGTGGIINIISRKQTNGGFHAMVSANYGFTGFSNENAAINYNKGKWGLRLNYNGLYEKDRIQSELHRHIIQSDYTIDQNILNTRRNRNNAMGMNLNFKPTAKDNLTLDVKLSLPRTNNLQDFHNEYSISGVPSSKQRLTDTSINRDMLESSLSYKHLFQPGKEELTLMSSVSNNKGRRPSYYYESGTMVQRSETGGHPFIFNTQADYMKMLGKTKMETGVKIMLRKNTIDHKMFERENEGQEWRLSPTLSNDMKHRELIPAAYAMIGSKITPRLNYKLGLRMEYSHVSVESEREHTEFQRDDLFLAPNLVFNYKASDPLTMTFALSRRITRPAYPQLNPYINLIDNQTYEQGNPRLKPEKTNKLDLGYTYTGKKLTLSGNLYLNYTQDYISQIAYLGPTALVMTYLNADKDIKTGIEQNVKFSPSKWISIDLATNTYYSDSKGTFEGADIRNHGLVNNSNITFNVKIHGGYNLQAQYFLTTPQYFPQFTTKTIHYGNLGLKKTLMKGSLTLSALLTDVFNTRRWDISSDNAIYTLSNNSKNKSRMAWVGITWNFNSFKPLENKKKQEENRSVIRLGE